MDKQRAKKLIEETFNGAFDEKKYLYFIKELFNGIDESKKFNYQGNYIKDKYKGHIKQYRRLGQYKTPAPESKIIDVIIVHLEKEKSLDRARTMQRNFIADYLKERDHKDAAIVAFYTDGQEDWRFSLVCMNYKLEYNGNDKVKIKEDLTPARRYSFLVGINEPNHTAQQQLYPLLKDDVNNPRLSDLESAFNIESVSDEFFEKYKERFYELMEGIDKLREKDKKIGAEFDKKEIATSDFAKKLMGQLVFLYFIQKKGWLGVERDCKWGTGPKDFLNLLFNKKITDYNNFFNDVLEPLFYEGLAVERGDAYFSQFKCKIPFLNGGLFEPVNSYDWVKTDIVIDNDVFKKIFETFNLYNFTVKEDEPLDKEVAVDPEMLGKVFERLMEVKDRKSKGAYYTPREIVHYMCQESLINYLITELDGKIKPEDIELFIHKGEFAVENDKAKDEGTKSYPWKMPPSVRQNAELLDEKLKGIKICDPAIGSGAFPVGMLHEIVKARNVLTTYIGDEKNRTLYELKRHAIHENIYGVDIDPSAVDIAKLRLWLSLVVDEENFENIKPLPNLDYKIMQGNSLLEEFEGVKLFDEKIIAKNPEQEKDVERLRNEMTKLTKDYISAHRGNEFLVAEEVNNRLEEVKTALKKVKTKDDKGKQTTLDDVESVAVKLAEELKKLQDKFFNESNTNRKKQLKETIDKTIWELIEISLKEQGKEDVLKKVAKYRQSNSRPFFLWKLNFEDVFESKGGFDVVIGNPPYIQLQKFKGDSVQESLKRHGYSVYDSNGDIYCLFYEKGLSELCNNGVLCYITSNKWMRAGYGKILREFFSKYKVISLIELGPGVFKNATVDTNIILIKNKKGNYNTKALKLQSMDTYNNLIDEFKSNSITISNLSSNSWNILTEEENSLISKIDSVSKPLKDWNIKIYRGILTGLNEAFIIDQTTYKKIVSIDTSSKNIIEPILQGKDIIKYGYKWNDIYLINTRFDLNVQKKYPTVYEHLKKYEKDAKKREDQGKNWFNLRACDYYEDFKKEKIVWKRIGSVLRFGYDNKGYYGQDSTCIMTGDNLIYLCAYMNSKIGQMLLFDKAPKTGTGDLIVSVQALEPLLIPVITKENQNIVKKIEAIVKEIIKKNELGKKTVELEVEIDNLFYQMLELNSQEIELINEKMKTNLGRRYYE